MPAPNEWRPAFSHCLVHPDVPLIRVRELNSVLRTENICPYRKFSAHCNFKTHIIT